MAETAGDVPGPVRLPPQLATILGAAVTANANIIILVLLGVAATFRGVFDQKGISDLGKLVYHISLPSLLLVSILKEVSFQRLSDLVLLPVVCFVQVTCAYGMTCLLNRIFRIPEVEARPVLATVTFGNVGALSIAVLQALCHQHPFKHVLQGPHSEGHCEGKSTSFVAFYLVTQNILMFTWGERILIRKALDEEQIQRDRGRASSANSQTPSEPLLNQHNVNTASSGNQGGWTISVPSLTAMQYNAEDNDEGSEETLNDTSGYRGLQDLQERDAGQDLQLRLTSAALNEVSSRLPLEAKVWTPEGHGGAAAIRKAAKDEVEEDDESHEPSEARNGSRTSSSSMNPEERRTNYRTALSGLAHWCKDSRQAIFTSVRRWSARRCYRGTRRRLIHAQRAAIALLRNPPLRAACLGLFIGMVPPLKALFVGREAPLRCAFDALSTLGGCQVPVSMLMLSGSGTLRYLKNVENAMDKRLGEHEVDAPSFAFSRPAVFIMIFGRLICVPLLGLVCWWAIKRLNLMPEDPLIGFVLLVESAVPSAQNVVMLLLVHGELAQGAAMAEVILWQYIIAIPVFTVWCCIFALCIFPGSVDYIYFPW